MNKKETAMVMTTLQAAYPNFYKGMTEVDIESIVKLWAKMFEDEPYNVVIAAVYQLIATDTKGFPPHIGALKDAITKIKTTEEMTEMEAWGLVKKACRNSNYNSAEEYAKLPPVVQRLVGSAAQLREWAQMDTETLDSVVGSNFQRSYKVRAKSEREMLALPSSVRNYVAQLAEGFSMDRPKQLGAGIREIGGED